MMHKSEDYKISAVKYYLKNKDNIRKTCKIFDCKKSTLQRWIQRYNSNPYQDRNNYKNNTEYKQDFYHTFSDPWKVRNDVEKNGHIVNEFGEVFSKEQIKEYKKLGHNIILDSNIHGDKSTK